MTKNEMRRAVDMLDSNFTKLFPPRLLIRLHFLNSVVMMVTMSRESYELFDISASADDIVNVA